MSPRSKPAVPPIPPEIQGTLGFLMVRVHKVLRAEIEQELRGHDFSLAHFAMLGKLRHDRGLRQTDLCDLMAIDRTTVMKLVDDLEARELVRRERHADDRRAYTVEITDAGRAFFARLLPGVLAQEQSFMAPLSPGERALLQEMLLRLVNASLDRRQAGTPT